MECPHIPEIRYGEFSKQLYTKVAKQRIPISGTIEITHRCNLDCIHCYCNLPISDKKAAQQELNYEEICDIINQVAQEGCLWLCFTGGEPLIRKDFIDIYAYAKNKGFIVTLFTNGTLITPEIANYLKRWPPFSVEISLYGITRDTYESVTRISGSFNRCMKGIHLLLERKLPLKLKTMVMTANLHEIWDMKTYGQNLGVNYSYDVALNPRLDGDKQPCQYRITPQEVVELDLEDRDRLREWKEFCKKFWGPSRAEFLYDCGGGETSFTINPYGKLQICIMVTNPNYNLRQGEFREGWNNIFPEFKAQKSKSEYKCSQCDLYTLCDQCAGWAQLENSDPEEPVEYLCRIAHLRAKMFRVKEVIQDGRKVKESLS